MYVVEFLSLSSSIYKVRAYDVSNVHVKSFFFYTIYKVHMNDVTNVHYVHEYRGKPVSYKVQIKDNKRSKVNFYSFKGIVEHLSSNTFRLG